eukprot:UN10542
MNCIIFGLLPCKRLRFRHVQFNHIHRKVIFYIGVCVIHGKKFNPKMIQLVFLLFMVAILVNVTHHILVQNEPV